METRKIYAILLSLIIPLFAYGNEVNNPSMEGAFISQPPLGYVAEYWTGWGETGWFWENTDYAHDGSKSQEIHWSPAVGGFESFGPDGIYQQISSLQPGQSYRVSVWFKFRFDVPIGWGQGNITCRVGTDPNGGTNPDVVTNWTGVSDSGGEWYNGPWLNVVTYFSPNGSTATLFIKADGSGEAWAEDPEPMEAGWMAWCCIDDANVSLIQISPDSNVSATTPIPTNGASYSEVTITVVDSNGNPIEDIPPWEVGVDCTGSGNIITQPTQSTDENGQTTAQIRSTVVETKTVSVTVLGTTLSNTPPVEFIEPECNNLFKLHAPDGATEDFFGWSVSISGDYAIVGSSRDDDNGSDSGSAYIFKLSFDVNDPNWYQPNKLTASDGASGDCFGSSVSINGDYAIVGAYKDDDKGSDSGSAYIFKRSDDANDPNWYEQDKLTASDGAYEDYFGYSVSISGDYAIVGAYGDDDPGSQSGSAYIFKRSDDPNDPNWYQKDKLKASDAAHYDEFGFSVSINGDYAIIGAFYDDDKGSCSGSAYIFTPNNIDPNNWIQQAKLTASDGASYDKFGYSVSINGDYAIVGADEVGNYSGSAYIYKREGINWIEQDKLTASDAGGGDFFGISVSIDGDYAITGACSNSAYIFKRSDEVNDPNWYQYAKLTALDGGSFGRSVGISGDYVIAGAYWDDDNGIGSGSAYILATLIGDLDGDGDVDFVDFSILANQWLQALGHPCADIAPCGGDCIVDFWDLAVLCDHWLE